MQRVRLKLIYRCEMMNIKHTYCEGIPSCDFQHRIINV